MSVSRVGCPADRSAMKRRMSMGRGSGGMVASIALFYAGRNAGDENAPGFGRGGVVLDVSGSVPRVSPPDR